MPRPGPAVAWVPWVKQGELKDSGTESSFSPGSSSDRSRHEGTAGLAGRFCFVNGFKE